MSLLIQQYLRAGGDPKVLKERGIKMRRHGERGSLVLFKYDINADFADQLVRECRGLVLDASEGWRVVGRAFDKFFSLGEGHAAEIDWSTARVQEKLDGSLCTLYCHNGAWLVATTGTPDASGDTHGTGVTFSTYFWKTFFASGGKLPDVGAHGHMCFSFELMGPLNRIVVVHAEPWLRLLSARDRETGECLWPETVANIVGIPPVRSFPLTNTDEIVASFEHISPVSQEGYVVVDGAFNRIKIKHPGYVALHHAKDGMGPKAFVQIARTGEQSEVLTAFPEFRPLIEDARARYLALCEHVRAEYERLKHLPTQKEFALEAVKTPHSAALFQLRKGVDLETFYRDIAIDKLMAWMGIADEEPMPRERPSDSVSPSGTCKAMLETPGGGHHECGEKLSCCWDAHATITTPASVRQGTSGSEPAEDWPDFTEIARATLDDVKDVPEWSVNEGWLAHELGLAYEAGYAHQSKTAEHSNYSTPRDNAGISADGHRSHWRNGHKVGRTLYRDNVLIGTLDTPELAALAARAVNAYAGWADDKDLECTTTDYETMRDALVKIMNKVEHDCKVYVLAAEALPREITRPANAARCAQHPDDQRWLGDRYETCGACSLEMHHEIMALKGYTSEREGGKDSIHYSFIEDASELLTAYRTVLLSKEYIGRLRVDLVTGINEASHTARIANLLKKWQGPGSVETAEYREGTERLTTERGTCSICVSPIPRKDRVHVVWGKDNFTCIDRKKVSLSE